MLGYQNGQVKMKIQWGCTCKVSIRRQPVCKGSIFKTRLEIGKV